jgi:DNA-binding NtrC family response regulator
MKTILIADPEYGAGSVAEAFQREGYQSVPETNARTALEILKQGHRIDLVITELLFPDMDGMEFLSAVRRIAPDLPVIVVTALCSVESYLLALNLGAAEFMNKPVPITVLFRIVQTTLEQSRSRDFPSKEGPALFPADAGVR